MRTSLSVALLLAAVAAAAQTPGPALGGGCVNKKLSELCGGAAMGSPDFAACATKRLAEASAACQPTLPSDPAPAAAKTAYDPANPCADDLHRFCQSAAYELPGSRSCLLSHRAQLAPACAASLPKEQPEHPRTAPVPPRPHFHQEVIVGRCSQEDIRDFCPDAASDAALNACLEAHEAEVSKRCRILIADGKRKRRVGAACKSEIESLCNDTKTADDAIMCLYRAEATKGAVSAGCKSSLAPREDD